MISDQYPDPSNLNVLCLYKNDNSDDFLHYIHIERKALNACIQNGFILKHILSGSLAIQYRKPDIFSPEAVFSLAFL